MSEVHVHGVMAAADRIDIASAKVRLVAHRDVAALVTDADVERLTAAKVLREHWRVLEEAAATATVLPVRFGTVMAGERAVVDEFLAPGHDGLAAQLRELDGKVQLTVKGSFEEEELMRGVVAGSPAIARLRERVRSLPEAAAYYENIELGQMVAAEVERARERDTETVLARLEPPAVASRREAPSALDAAVNAAFLVERDRIDEFSRAVTELAHELAGRVELRYVGPLAPYSFTGEAASPGAAAWA
jgi:Gas vesicle synthesis protein GvpL/GvpF